jgi:hypothetical protein
LQLASCDILGCERLLQGHSSISARRGHPCKSVFAGHQQASMCMRLYKGWRSQFCKQNERSSPLTGCDRQTLEKASGYQPEDGTRRAILKTPRRPRKSLQANSCSSRRHTAKKENDSSRRVLSSRAAKRGKVWKTEVFTDYLPEEEPILRPCAARLSHRRHAHIMRVTHRCAHNACAHTCTHTCSNVDPTFGMPFFRWRMPFSGVSVSCWGTRTINRQPVWWWTLWLQLTFREILTKWQPITESLCYAVWHRISIWRHSLWKT